jgi:Holliday junction resolvase-like predicted endonuclease
MMISIDITNLFHQVIIAILIIIILYLGWKIKSLYKNFLFYLLKRRGRKGEKKAIKLLKKNGYKILSSQKTIQGYLYENDIKILYEVRPDYLVEKNDIIYIAEVKTGLAALIGERNTRRQLLEYSKLLNSSKVILVDLTRNKIKVIEF